MYTVLVRIANSHCEYYGPPPSFFPKRVLSTGMTKRAGCDASAASGYWASHMLGGWVQDTCSDMRPSPHP